MDLLIFVSLNKRVFFSFTYSFYSFIGFQLLFCVGDFFGSDNSQWEKYASGNVKVPIATFILGPNDTTNESYFTDPNGCELCGDVTYLGK